MGHVGLTWEPPWTQTINFPSVFQCFWLADVGVSWKLFSHLWASLGPSWGHLEPSWALPGAISWSSLAILGPLWSLFGRPWGALGAILGQLQGRSGSLGSSLGGFGAMSCHLEVSWELFGRHWSLPGAILGQIGVFRIPRGPSCGHLEAYWGVSDLLYFSDAWSR